MDLAGMQTIKQMTSFFYKCFFQLLNVLLLITYWMDYKELQSTFKLCVYIHISFIFI